MSGLSSFISSQPQVVQALGHALKNGTLHHALALVGADSRLLGRALYARLLCDQAASDSIDFCALCRSCKLVSNHGHPDGFIVSDAMSLDQARSLTQRLSLRPRESAQHVVWFEAPSRLTASVQNALLKVVEEPPTQATFIFSLTAGDTLLSTLRSRLVGLRLRPPALVSAGGGKSLFDRVMAQATRNDLNHVKCLVDAGVGRFFTAAHNTWKGVLSRAEQLRECSHLGKEEISLSDYLTISECLLYQVSLEAASNREEGLRARPLRSSGYALDFLWHARSQLVFNPNKTLMLEQLFNVLTPPAAEAELASSQAASHLFSKQG